jgi:hypothetical protein
MIILYLWNLKVILTILLIEGEWWVCQVFSMKYRDGSRVWRILLAVEGAWRDVYRQCVEVSGWVACICLLNLTFYSRWFGQLKALPSGRLKKATI